MDTVLFILTGACNLLLGYMGFHVTIAPPTGRNLRYWRAGFLGVGALSLVFLIITGFRSASVNAQMQSFFNANDRPARLEITEVTVHPPDGEMGLFFNFYYKNAGNHSAQGLHAGGLVGASHDDTPQFEDSLFQQLWAQPLLHNFADLENSTMEIPPGASRFNTVPSSREAALDKPLVDQMLRVSNMFAAFIVQWRDKETGTTWITEACYWWYPDSAVHLCVGHNRTYQYPPS